MSGRSLCAAGSEGLYVRRKMTAVMRRSGLPDPSAGSVDRYDNALMETIIGLFKTTCIRTTVFHAGPFKGLADVEFATAGWVGGWVDWYNNRRLHRTRRTGSTTNLLNSLVPFVWVGRRSRARIELPDAPTRPSRRSGRQFRRFS